MPCSKIDIIYRSLILSKYFDQGWGNPNVLKKLLKFRKIVSKSGECCKLVPEYYPVKITKDNILPNSVRIIEGYFITPFELYFPDLLPAETKNAYFQAILPLEWKSDSYKPICLHMAGTGDHYFWRRRQLIAKPLLYEAGIASIIIENPFYGLRKPSTQIGSVLHNVTDIFLMGVCLMMEAIVLFRWCKRNGFGPLGVTGISMGGHMASLAAASWPFPIVLVPCLSWSTASVVFTEGVMSKAINWDLLFNQIKNIDGYNTEHNSLLQEIKEHINRNDPVDELSTQLNQNLDEQQNNDTQHIFRNINTFSIFKQNSIFDIRKKNISLENLPAIDYLNKLLKKVSRKYSRKSKHYKEALDFMSIIMDDCTNLSNYPVPVDTSLIICICALNDAYVPREGVVDLSHIWPGVEIRYLQCGHVSAFLFHQRAFRQAIIEAFQRYQSKYL
ncbi:hypothetical protein O3M35_010776 [Rhynocoris fuscipes]